MIRLSFIEFICIVAIGVAMVELAPDDRYGSAAGKAGASALTAKLAAAVREEPAPAVVIPRSTARER